jgi:uncharacterized protein (DUF433 family)
MLFPPRRFILVAMASSAAHRPLYCTGANWLSKDTTMVTTKPARTVIHDETILRGEPIISGTHIPVRSVYLMAKSYRGDLAAVQHALPTLSLADISLALRYQRENPDEIAAWIAYDASDDDDPL